MASLRVVPQPVDEHVFAPPFAGLKSAQAIARFPFPFTQPVQGPYRYSVNIEPHETDGIPGSPTEHFFDVDEFYFAELQERRRALKATPQHSQVLPEVTDAAQELTHLSLARLAHSYPNYFIYSPQGHGFVWQNHLTGQAPTLFDPNAPLTESKPDPLPFLTSQLPGDWALLQQQDNQLWLKGGVVTGPASWSLSEKLGMNYLQWHSPVPDQHQVFQRSLKYLLRLPPGQPVRRKNWGLCVHPRLEMSMENRREWQHELQNTSENDLPQLVNLRVELQVLERLPKSQAIAFYIRTYFLSLAELKQNPEWASRLVQVLEELSSDIAEYKNIAGVRMLIIKYLSGARHY
ncbi:heme-dependent oxidative N-demethylase family protein [Halioxenophilus aromaticivorans]|uniref:DUF3445 domain-containing protein n=1 Tax=Halioxenophilus aromaticivorans TaxID=1306992 RepID=A0AAV3U1C0_9ALTE